MPDEWKYKDFDDADVITAYTNFCRDLIKRFKPDFMAYGIEVNTLLKNDPSKWNKFVKFVREVYAAIKAAYPKLPLFLTSAEIPQDNEKEHIKRFLKSCLTQII